MGVRAQAQQRAAWRAGGGVFLYADVVAGGCGRGAASSEGAQGRRVIMRAGMGQERKGAPCRFRQGLRRSTRVHPPTKTLLRQPGQRRVAPARRPHAAVAVRIARAAARVQGALSPAQPVGAATLCALPSASASAAAAVAVAARHHAAAKPARRLRTLCASTPLEPLGRETLSILTTRRTQRSATQRVQAIDSFVPSRLLTAYSHIACDNPHHGLGAQLRLWSGDLLSPATEPTYANGWRDKTTPAAAPFSHASLIVVEARTTACDRLVPQVRVLSCSPGPCGSLAAQPCGELTCVSLALVAIVDLCNIVASEVKQLATIAGYMMLPLHHCSHRRGFCQNQQVQHNYRHVCADDALAPVPTASCLTSAR
ncbi:hypothetical protein SVAN01_01809 [Stagonosporopsis vannaccii]|nr:hypothetical protein SVAN01_01809 [Stagonosporopsis vannaccii]